MSIYYIDCENGNGNGLCPENPRRTYLDLDLHPGDQVLFKRGMVFFGCLETVSGTTQEPIVYGAYGEGEKPVFIGSIDVSDEGDWVSEGDNIWRCVKKVPREACNFIFNEGECCGSLCWEKSSLSVQGDWTDSRMGNNEGDIVPEPEKEVQNLWMYSESNPGAYYVKIECACRQFRSLGIMRSNIVVEDLCFKNNGVHGLAGNGENIVVRNCDFFFIGGCVWSKKLKIRFGNGVEFWNTSCDVYVENNLFYDIYDSGVTHQGNKVEGTADLHFDHNVFVKCGMAAYEGRDIVPQGLTFNYNICIDAGEGFSKNGVIMPRNSEIWPQPMGHHVFLWRMTGPTKGGSIQMKGNVFHNAPYGAAVYSIIDPTAEEQMEMDENIYYTENEGLLNHLNGTSYADFNAYQKAVLWDKNSVYRKTDVRSFQVIGKRN